jgi:uncharacterized membrane protein
MKVFAITYFISLLLLLIFDAIWLLFIIKDFVSKSIGHLMAENVKVFPVLIFYPLYALAITVLVVFPAINGDFSILKVLLFGGLLGLAAYGAYDLTNHATLTSWPAVMSVVDMSWGMIVTGGVSLLSFYLVNLFIK